MGMNIKNWGRENDTQNACWAVISAQDWLMQEKIIYLVAYLHYTFFQKAFLLPLRVCKIWQIGKIEKRLRLNEASNKVLINNMADQRDRVGEHVFISKPSTTKTGSQFSLKQTFLASDQIWVSSE